MHGNGCLRFYLDCRKECQLGCYINPQKLVSSHAESTAFFYNSIGSRRITFHWPTRFTQNFEKSTEPIDYRFKAPCIDLHDELMAKHKDHKEKLSAQALKTSISKGITRFPLSVQCCVVLINVVGGVVNNLTIDQKDYIPALA